MVIEDELLGNFVSSSEEERDDRIRRSNRERIYQTPFKSDKLFFKRSSSTPATATQMTPSPNRSSPLMDGVSPNPGASPTRAPGPPSNASFFEAQQGFLDNNVSTALFQDPTPSRTRRKGRGSSRRSRLSQSLLLDNYQTPKAGMERRRSSIHRKHKSFGQPPSPGNSSPELSSMDSTPESSPNRMYARASSFNALETIPHSSTQNTKGRGRSILFLWGFLALAMTSCLGMICLTRSAVKLEQAYEATRPDAPLSAAGLRGQMTSGHWDGRTTTKQKAKKEKGELRDSSHKKDGSNNSHNKHSKHHPDSPDHHVVGTTPSKHPTSNQKPSHHNSHGSHGHHEQHDKHATLPKLHLPPPPIFSKERKFDSQDVNMYAHHSSKSRRVIALDPSNTGTSVATTRSLKLYPADFTDNTQLYSILDSSDERLSHMELRAPYSEGECVPMQDWQTTFHPSCNGMHEIAMHNMGEDNGHNINLFGTKGFWRYAWRLDIQNVQEQDTMVLKTLKFEHNFEDAHFEHDRIDAVAMERLTSSPHVISAFGFCGHSVLTEYADGSRVGELADKSKKTPLARLKIARDIARGLADVHGIDGDGNATFVHLDVNPANVVSVGGTLKLNDFNIGIIRRWNTTSNTPCGFPAQYPNPQWRSPEEARNEQDLTEKVDVFSMGHIFFRLICGHEPWNKLEPGGRPTKEEVSIKVQRGDLPFVPEDIRNTDDAEVAAIRDAMLSCYTFDPVKRPSARTVANALDQALEALRGPDQQ